MADDITLTVRVRDLSGAALTRVNQQVNRLDRNFRNTRSSANQNSASYQRLGNDLNRLNAAFRRMVSTGTLTRAQFNNMNRDLNVMSRGLRQAVRSGDITRAAFRSMSRDVDVLRARMVLVGRQGNIFTRLAARVSLLREHFRRLGERAGLVGRALARLGDFGARGMSRALRMLGGLASALGAVGRFFGKISQTMLIFLAVVALIGPAAQALGALLVTALAGAFVALGAFALRSSAQVKGAFKQMKSDLSTVLTQAAAPLTQALSQGMLQIGAAAKQMAPQLRAAFAATAPLVENLAGAVTDFAAQALPGFTYALQNSKKAMAGFRTFLGLVGQGLGNMFKIITQGNDENLAKAWVVLGDEVKNALESIGEFTSSMLKSGSATLLTIGIFRTFTGALNLVSAVFKTLDTVLGGLPGKLANLIDSASELGSTFGDSDNLAGLTLSQMKSRLKEVNDNIKKTREEMKKVRDLPGPIKNTLDSTLNEQLKQREQLLAAISEAEGRNSDTVQQEAVSYQNLLKAIQALADQNRNYLDSVAAEEQAIDDADKKIKGTKKEHTDYSHALKLVNGQLTTLSTQTGRDAYDMLSKIAQATKDSTDKAVAANVPWEQVQKNWKTGYDNIVRLADGMGLTKEQAKQLANQILGLPPEKSVVVKAQTADAITSLDGVIAAMKATPSAKTITVKTLSAEAEQLLEQLGFTVERLPDGTITITAKTGSASENIGKVQAARDGLQGKSITLKAKDASTGTIQAIIGWLSRVTGKTVTVTTVYRSVFEQVGHAPSTTADALRKQAQRFGGGAIGGSFSQVAARGFATGGSISGQVLDGPGTSTSDSILARLSKGEFVVRADAVRKYGVGAMMAINSGLVRRIPGFASGGSVSKSEKDARKEARDELTLSHFGIKAGYKNDEFVHQLGMADGIDDLVNNLGKWRVQVMKMAHGGVEKNLLKQLDKAGSSLLKYEKQQASVTKKLEAAKDKLDDLKQAASQLKDSIKNQIIGDTDITKAAGADESQLTINTLLSQMSANAGQASAFDKALKELAKRGLSKELIAQIAQAGISGGGLETATAILGGSNAQIKTLNSFESQIQKSAASAGTTASDAMYKAGIKAAQGLVDGLTKQQKDIEKAMIKIATSMEKAIKKALGIHSPSRVMMEIGHQTAQGFAQGVDHNTAPRRAVENMVGLPVRSAHSSYPSSTQPIVVQLHIADKHLGELVIDPLRKSIRHRGGNVQAVLGK